MRPGMNCGIEILAEEIRDTLYAPLQAVMLSKGETVAFVAKDGRTEERPVKVGKQNDKWVQILAGLSDGEEVLLAPPPGFLSLKSAEEEGPAASGDKDKEKGAPNADPAKPATSGGEGRMRRGGGKKPAGAPQANGGDASGAAGGAAAPAAAGDSGSKPAPVPTGAAGGSGNR